MSLTTCCKLCEYYISSGRHKNQGCCNRLDDPSYVYVVKAGMKTCLYENPGKEIFEQEHQKRLTQQQQEEKQFTESLANASRIVSSWPDWKRYGIGRLL